MITLKEIKANNGATLNRFGDSITHTRGYQVSTLDLLTIPAYKLRKRTIKMLLRFITESNENLGIWIDNNKAYIDISEYFTRKRDALKIGKENRQLSIWNFKEKSAIFL